MWIEQYLDRPLITTNAGFADERQFLKKCVYEEKGKQIPDSRAIFPVLSTPSGQYLINTKEQHTLIAGCTGSGKTRRVLIPAILNAMNVSARSCRPSMFIWDVKGEIHEITARTAQRCGYEVICIDLINPERSDGYSLMELARERWVSGDEAGAENALADLAAAISPMPKTGNIDPFWSKVSQAAFMGTSLYQLNRSPDSFSFMSVAEKIMEVYADEISARQFVNFVGRHCGKESSAYRFIKTALSGSDKTLQNVCTSILSDLSEFMKCRGIISIQQRRMSAALQDLTQSPTVIYFKTSEASPALYGFGKVLFSQLYSRLLEKAGADALSRPFEFFLDEVCNGLPIENLDKMLAMARSKNIRIHLIVQSLNQLTACYQEKADTIRSNCGVFIVLRTTDPSTWDYVSSLSGVDIRGRSLLNHRDLAHLELGQAVILSPDNLPYVASLADFTELMWI